MLLKSLTSLQNDLWPCAEILIYDTYINNQLPSALEQGPSLQTAQWPCVHPSTVANTSSSSAFNTNTLHCLILPVLQHLCSPSVWNQSPVCSDWLAYSKWLVEMSRPLAYHVQCVGTLANRRGWVWRRLRQGGVGEKLSLEGTRGFKPLQTIDMH